MIFAENRQTQPLPKSQITGKNRKTLVDSKVVNWTNKQTPAMMKATLVPDESQLSKMTISDATNQNITASVSLIKS